METFAFRFPWKQWIRVLLVELKPLGMLRCQAVWVSYRCWASTTRWTRQRFWFLMLLCLAFILRHIHKVSWLLIVQLSFWNISLILFLGWLIVQMGFLRSSTYCRSLKQALVLEVSMSLVLLGLLPLGCSEKCRGPTVFDASTPVYIHLYDWIYHTWYIYKVIMHILYTH